MLQRLFLISFISSLTLWLSSCSNNYNLAEHIPGDASMVAAINLQEFSKQLNLPSSIDSSAAISAAIGIDVVKITSLMKVLPAIDITRVYVVRLPQVDAPLLLMRITDSAALTKSLSAIGYNTEAISSERLLFTHPDPDVPSMLLRDNRLWYVGVSRRVRNLIECLDEFYDNHRSFAELPASDEALRLDNNAAVVAFPSHTFAPEGSVMFAGKANVDGDRLDISFSFLDSESNPISFKGLKDIDPNLAESVPADMPLIFAAGFEPSFPWSHFRSTLEAASSSQYHFLIESAVSYLSRVDGSTLIAIAPDDFQSLGSHGNFFTDWHMIVAAKFPDQQAADIVNEAKSMLLLTNTPHSVYPQGAISVNLPQLHLSLSNSSNGYLYLNTLNRQPDSTYTIHSSLLHGHKAILRLDTPVLSTIFPGTGAPNFGVNFTAVVDQPDVINCTLVVTHSQRSFTSAIFKLLRWFHSFDPDKILSANPRPLLGFTDNDIDESHTDIDENDESTPIPLYGL